MSTSLPIAFTKLDDDSLLTIFEIITLSGFSGDPPRPLAVIRAASQVCRQWRQLLIQSPWIWGRVVDFDVVAYGPRRMEWMREVLRRAGESAPLWVSGRVDVSKTKGAQPRFDSEAFFIRVIELLERIERVSLVIHGHKIPSRITKPFLSRAPILKIFHLRFPSISEPALLNTLHPESSKRLFADDAPCLEDIHTVNVAIRVDSQCLSKIRKFGLPSLARDPVSLQNILVLLQHMPSLQRLVIGAQYSTIPSTSLLTPNLDVAPPRLSYLVISSNLWIASKILGCVVPGDLSVFQISVHDVAQNLVHQDVLPSFTQNLPSFISSYFTFNKPTRVDLYVSLSSFLFTVPSSLSHPNPSSTFSIHKLRGEVDQPAVIACLFGAFLGAPAPCHYQSVDEIKLSLWELRSNTFDFSTLYSMLALFQNVQSMTIDEESCKTLLELDDIADRRLFPKLHTVFLTCILRASWHDPPTWYPNVVEFLSHRKKIGFPVAKLDTRTSVQKNRKTLRDLSGLEQVGGLEVIWTQPKPGSEDVESVEVCSYTCGSGDPQRLKFTI